MTVKKIVEMALNEKEIYSIDKLLLSLSSLGIFCLVSIMNTTFKYQFCTKNAKTLFNRKKV